MNGTIKHISTVCDSHGSVVTTTVVDTDNKIFRHKSSEGIWREIPTENVVKLEPIDAVQTREFDEISLKKAYIAGIMSYIDPNAKNPYSPMDDCFSVWIEGRAFALS